MVDRATRWHERNVVIIGDGIRTCRCGRIGALMQSDIEMVDLPEGQTGITPIPALPRFLKDVIPQGAEVLL